MASKPSNAINCQSTTSGLVNFDGTSAFSTTGLTQYNVLTGAGANTVNNVVPSTSGYVLQSNGASSQPSFQIQGFQLLSSQVASNVANISFTGLTANTIFVSIVNAQPVTTTKQLEMQITVDGSTWIVLNYTAGVNYNQYNSATYTNFSATTNAPITNTMPNNKNATASFYCYNVNVGSAFFYQGFSNWFDSTANTNVFGLLGGSNTNTGVTGLRFLYATGNINVGTFTLYALNT